jgi:hypothetical protein
MDLRLQRIGDEQAIRDVLARYWRGVDRRDATLVASAYHDDAYDDHGYYKGPVRGFVESLEPGAWRYFRNTQHFSGHISVEFVGSGDARVESYAEAHHIRCQNEDQLDDLVYGLRYVDRFTLRDGEWRIAHRVCTWDWHRIDPVGGIPLPDSYFRGHHSHADPVFRHPSSNGRRVEASVLLAKQACYDTLMRYARGVDRCDIDLVGSAYHADAYDDHGGYRGDVKGFLEWVQPTVMQSFSCTMHKLGNVLIEIDGDEAFAETYAIAHHVQADQEVPSDLIMGVRYIDRLEQRAGEWKIARREMSFEWERSLQIGSQAAIDSCRRGQRDGTDPVLRKEPSDRVSGVVSESIAPILARAEIYSVIALHCRGLDRRDESLVRSAYHPDATIESLGDRSTEAERDARPEQGGVDRGLDRFTLHLRSLHDRFRATSHKLGQVLIEFGTEDERSATVAYSEAYAICHYIGDRSDDPTPRAASQDHVVGLRYVDRFERRSGSWRIAQREIRCEWIRQDALEDLDPSWTLGSSDSQDPVFDWP